MCVFGQTLHGSQLAEYLGGELERIGEQRRHGASHERADEQNVRVEYALEHGLEVVEQALGRPAVAAREQILEVEEGVLLEALHVARVHQVVPELVDATLIVAQRRVEHRLLAHVAARVLVSAQCD